VGPTEKFIKELGKTNHPLGKPVREKEVDSLVQNLMTRLDLTRKELDFSPGSISKLEKALTLLRDRLVDNGILLHPDDIVLLVREITAYI
jgi:hypothetical protein